MFRCDTQFNFPSIFMPYVTPILKSYISDFDQHSKGHYEYGSVRCFELGLGSDEISKVRQDLMDSDIPFDICYRHDDGLDEIEYFRPPGLAWRHVHTIVPIREGTPVAYLDELKRILTPPASPEWIADRLRYLIQSLQPEVDLTFWSECAFQHLLNEDEDIQVFSHLLLSPSLSIETIQIVQCTSCHRFYRFEPNDYPRSHHYDIFPDGRLYFFEDGELLDLHGHTPCRFCPSDALRLVALIDADDQVLDIVNHPAMKNGA